MIKPSLKSILTVALALSLAPAMAASSSASAGKLFIKLDNVNIAVPRHLATQTFKSADPGAMIQKA